MINDKKISVVAHLGHDLFKMAKAHFKLQGFLLFEDGEIWNDITGTKVAELKDFKVKDGNTDIVIKTMASIEYINVNIVIDNND